VNEPDRGERLYHTAGDRLVLSRWSRWQGEKTTYRYISADEARDWLIANGYDEAVERIFGEPVEPERAPAGRPEIGPQIVTRIPRDMLEQIDAVAKGRNQTRAETMRQLVEDGLSLL
jgi:hypothetical protein